MIEIAIIADNQMTYDMWLIQQKVVVNINFTRVVLPKNILGRQFNGYIILEPDEGDSGIRSVLIDYLKASLFQSKMQSSHRTLLQLRLKAIKFLSKRDKI